MKNLEHTIRDLLEKRQPPNSKQFLENNKILEDEFLLFLEQNSNSGKSQDVLIKEFVELKELKGDATKYLLGKLFAPNKLPKAPTVPGRPSTKPIEEPKVPAKPAEQPKTPTKPAEEPKTPAKPVEEPPSQPPAKPAEEPKTPAKPTEEPAAPAKPDEKTTPLKPAEDAKPATTPKSDAKPAGGKSSGGSKGIKTGLAALAAGAAWDFIKKLLNPGSGGQGSGITMMGNPDELHKAGLARTVESVSPGTKIRTSIENVSRPKLKKLNTVLGKQGSIEKKIVDESTEQFIKRVRAAKEKDKQKNSFEAPVKETETVSPAGKLNKETPDN